MTPVQIIANFLLGRFNPRLFGSLVVLGFSALLLVAAVISSTEVYANPSYISGAQSSPSAAPLSTEVLGVLDRSPQYDVSQLHDPDIESVLAWYDPSGKVSLSSLPAATAWTLKPGHGKNAYKGRQWNAFTLINSTQTPRRVVISFDEAFLEEVDLYQLNGAGAFEHSENGIRIPIRERRFQTRVPAFELVIPAQGKVPVLIAYKSRFEAHIGLQVQTPREFANWVTLQSSSYTFFIGGALAIILFNLFLYASIREPLYLIYVFHGLCVIGFVLRYSGYSLYVIETPENHYKLAVISWLQAVLIVEFTRRLLDVKRFAPKLNTLLKVFAGLFLLIGVATWFNVEFYSVGIRASFIALVFLFSIGIYSASQRNPMGVFYVIAQTPYLLGYVALAGLSAGWMEYSFLSRYGFMVGSLLELVTFALALGYRFRQSEQGQFAAQNKYLALQNSLNSELQEQVAARTGELERATAQLRSLTADYANLLQNISVGVVSMNALNQINFRNAAFTELARRIPELEAKLISRVSASEDHETEEIVITTSDGGQHHLVVNACHRESEDDEPGGHWIVITDVSQLRTNEASLSHAAKMATLGEMSTGMAHELNQPLNVIRLSLENMSRALKRDTIDRDKLKSRLERINSQVERAGKLISHMRTFGRIAPGEFEPFELGTSILRAIDLLAEQMRLDQVELNFDGPELGCRVNGSDSQFEQVMLNLITNARDAIKERRPGERRIAIRLIEQGNTYRVDVEDTGGGIAPEIKERMFEPFFTTKKLGEGTGLGGAISYGIINDMAGTITADNGEQGARITITLPKFD